MLYRLVSRPAQLADLLDPDNPASGVAREGWFLHRQKRTGEPRAATRILRARTLARGTDPDLHLKPSPVQEVVRSNSERALSEKDKPLPPADLRPVPEWPPWARFRAYIDEPDLMPEATELDRFYTAEQVAALLEPVLQYRLERVPEDKEIIERIKRLMHYWVEHDRDCVPGEGTTTTVDGYTWDPEKIGR